MKTGILGAVAVALVVAIPIAADQQQGPNPPQRPGLGRGRIAPGGPGRGLALPLGGMFADVSEQQREQVKAILAEERQGGQGGTADMTLRRTLELELLADAPNALKIEELKQQIAASTIESVNRQIAVQQRINQVLTPQQRAEARARSSNPDVRDRRGRGALPRRHR